MRIKIKSNQIVYYILLLMPFVDLLTGYALNAQMNGVLTATGQVYRLIAFFYMFYILYGHKFHKKLVWLLLFTAYTMLLVVVDALRFQGSVFENSSYTIKLLFPIYLFYCLVYVSKNDGGLTERVIKAFSWIYPMSFIIPRLLGIGYYLNGYSFNSGYKGLYYAANEQNVVLMTLFVYNFQKLYDDLTYTKGALSVIRLNILNFVKLISIIISLLLIGSKTSLLAIAIVCILYLFRGEKMKVKLKFITTFVVVGLGVFTMIGLVLNEQLGNIAQRIVYSYNRYATAEGGLLTFVLSKRNLRIAPSIDYWYGNNQNSVLNFFFGVGKASKCPKNTISVNPFSLIELDFFDCLFWFGFIATVIVICFYLSFFLRTFKKPELFMEKIMFALIFCFSMLAGHVIMSPNSGAMFAMIICDIYLKSKALEPIDKQPDRLIELQHL